MHCHKILSQIFNIMRERYFVSRNRNITLCSPVLSSRSPVLRRQAMLASSCSQLEAIGGSPSQQQSSIPEVRVRPSTPSHQGAGNDSSAAHTSSSSAASEQPGGQSCGPALPRQALYLRQRAGKNEKDGESVRRDSEGLLRLVRSHSEPGLGSSTDTGNKDTNMKTCLTYLCLFP